MPLVHFFETSFSRTYSRNIIVVEVESEGLAGWGEVTAGENPFYNEEWTDSAWLILHDYVAPRVLGKPLNTPDDVLLGVQHILAEQRDGRADYIQRYADDFKAPYGLAYREGFVLVADQEGIWRVPHVGGAVRAGRPDQPKIADVPPEQRKPVPAAYGQELITQRGVFGVVAGHQQLDHRKTSERRVETGPDGSGHAAAV
jgi:hypothetical protein